jgi:DNA-binding CsgD family transcriptional regulator
MIAWLDRFRCQRPPLVSFPAATNGHRLIAPHIRRCPTCRQIITTGPDVLSWREREVLALAAEGLTAQEIARQFGLSPKTVENHLASVRMKLGGGNIVQAVLAGIERGLIDWPGPADGE